jgi:hypothetical protein
MLNNNTAVIIYLQREVMMQAEEFPADLIRTISVIICVNIAVAGQYRADLPVGSRERKG